MEKKHKNYFFKIFLWGIEYFIVISKLNIVDYYFRYVEPPNHNVCLSTNSNLYT
jgi:hypothetical protein